MSVVQMINNSWFSGVWDKLALPHIRYLSVDSSVIVIGTSMCLLI